MCCERRRRHLTSLESTKLLEVEDADDDDASATDADDAADAADAADVEDEAVVAACLFATDTARNCCFGLLPREL